jgi:hypothetical protein
MGEISVDGTCQLSGLISLLEIQAVSLVQTNFRPPEIWLIAVWSSRVALTVVSRRQTL